MKWLALLLLCASCSSTTNETIVEVGSPDADLAETSSREAAQDAAIPEASALDVVLAADTGVDAAVRVYLDAAPEAEAGPAQSFVVCIVGSVREQGCNIPRDYGASDVPYASEINWTNPDGTPGNCEFGVDYGNGPPSSWNTCATGTPCALSDTPGPGACE